MLKKELKWTVGHMKNINDKPEKRVHAIVPGAVQLDWARNEGWDSYTYSDNYKQYLWMEDVYWSYHTVLELPVTEVGERLYFVCKGVDYKYVLKLNGNVLHEQEGMFTSVELDITDRVTGKDEMEIIIYPVPKREGAPVGRSEADQCCKPAVSYGWDWHPRLIPVGIWEETYIEVRPRLHITNCEVFYNLSEDINSVNIELNTELSETGSGIIKWNLFDRNGKLVNSISQDNSDKKVYLNIEMESPELWWPNGQGEPALYKSEVLLYDCDGKLLDSKSKRVGFRKVRLVMHPGAWDEPSDFPKGRSNPPITMEINNRQIFCKGSNWVNPEIFPGIITDETYRPLIKLAKDANMNLFRSWGGGIINKDSFFELCDEMGIMVWQEFPLACNNYEGTRSYLNILEQESRSIIKRLRCHPSLVMWCGGNELFNAWSKMTDQSLALRLLNRNCYDLDPNTPFIMTSPLMGMAHGNYLFRYNDGREVFQVMPQAKNTAYTEFGCPGPSSVDTLKNIIPEEELFPPKPGTAWETHHAFNAWVGDTWLAPETIEDYFGVSRNLEQMVERGQLMQSEGYKCIFEEARRQKPTCSMALNWCYNEPWPTAANNSLIEWPAKPKPAYYAVKNSCRPVLASARINKFQWKAGEIFCPELWILNDCAHGIPSGEVEAYIRIGEEEVFLLKWEYSELEANRNLPGPIIRYILPELNADRFTLILKVPKYPEMNSEYIVLFKSRDDEQYGKSGVRILNT
jgi:beta-mannosidase